MIDDLIVVAAHGNHHVRECVESLGGRHRILVVDTGSDEPVSLEPSAHVDVIRRPYKCFGTGAYLHAYETRPARNYFFMQDSMRAKDDNFLAGFKERQPERGCVAWCTFGEGFDDEGQRLWGKYYYDGFDYPGKGIFGCIFYVNRESLDELAQRQLLPPIPRNKNQEQGNERLWSWAFHKAGMEVRDVAGQWDAGKMERGEFDVFSKQFAGRI